MEQLPNRIREWRLARGLSQKDLAFRIQPPTTQPTIDRLEKGERSLDTEWMRILANALGVSEADLLSRNSIEPGVQYDSSLAFSAIPTSGHAFSGPRDLPILGFVKAGSEGFFIVNGEIQGYAVRPDLLRGMRDAYAVYVHDDSMFPAFEPGHLVWVDPMRPIRAGDTVIVQLTDGQAFIKRLKRRTEKALICEQWNPAIEVRYETKKVKSLHLVVGSMRVVT